MPIKKAANKALKQNIKKQASNLKVVKNIKSLALRFRKAIAAKDKTKASILAKEYIKAVDKAAQKKIIKKNNAARKKSRLLAKLNLSNK